jgi:hypothetical protein
MHSPSSAGFDPETIRRAMEASLRSAGADALSELPMVTEHPEDCPRARSNCYEEREREEFGSVQEDAYTGHKRKEMGGGKMKLTHLVTPDGKSQSSLAKLRSRFGYDIIVQSEEDSETSEVASTKIAKMLCAKGRANDNVQTSGKASKKKKGQDVRQLQI